MNLVRRPALSARERDVWRLMAEGMTNDAIARSLALAQKTVEAVVHSLFLKLGLYEDHDSNRRVMATRWFLIESHSEHAHLMPDLSSPIIGRGRELDELEQLCAEHRLVTITGMGGIGKTRLASELMRRWLQRGARVRYIDLVGTDELSCPERFLAAFGVARPVGRSVVPVLHRALRLEPTIVIVDNAEHVLEVVRDLVRAVLEVPVRGVVVTSRRALDVDDEHVWSTPALDPLEALQLIVTRVCESREDADVGAAVLGAWCEELGGIPLAIELAAHHLATTTSPASAANRLAAAHLQDASSGRHESLAAVLDETIGSLPPAAHRLLVCLAPFRGGASTDGAPSTAVVVGDDVHAQLAVLVAAGLVVVGDGRTRMLEPVRQHVLSTATAHDRLAADSVLVEWAVEFTSGVDPGFLHEPGLWRSRLSREMNNIEAALDTALSIGRSASALTIIRQIWLFLATDGTLSTGRRVQRVLSHLDGTEPVGDRAWGLLAAGRLAALARRVDEAIPLIERSLADFESVGDEKGTTTAALWLGRATSDLALVERCMHDSRRLGMGYVEGWACMTLVHHRMRSSGNVADCVGLIDRTSEIARCDRMPKLAAYASLLRAETELQANWLGQASFGADEIDELLAEVEAYAKDAGGVIDRADLFSIVSQHHLHRHRWDSALTATRDQLENAIDTEDPILVAEAILMAGAALARSGGLTIARDAVRVAGPAFSQWASPLWLAFTLHPADVLYGEATVQGLRPVAELQELIAVATSLSAALEELRP